MKTTLTQKAQQIGISQGFLSNIISGRRRPHWKTAKKLAEATGTDPVLWLEGTSSQINEALSKSFGTT